MEREREKEREKVKEMRVLCSTNYRLASHWLFPDNLLPKGRRRSLVIVEDGYERGNILLKNFLWISWHVYKEGADEREGQGSEPSADHE